MMPLLGIHLYGARDDSEQLTSCTPVTDQKHRIPSSKLFGFAFCSPLESRVRAQEVVGYHCISGCVN